MSFSADRWDLGPGEGAEVTASVIVPANAVGGASDAVTVVFRSLSDPRSPAASASVELTTTARVVYEVELEAPLAAQDALPGEVAVYALEVTNTGNVADTIHFERTEPGWPTVVSPSSLTIAQGGQRAVTVYVTVPVTVTGGTEDVAIIRATGSGDYAEEPLVTTAQWRVYLPVVVREAP